MYIPTNSIKKPLVGDRQGALGKLSPGHLSGEHQKSAASLRAASVLHFNNILDFTSVSKVYNHGLINLKH